MLFIFRPVILPNRADSGFSAKPVVNTVRFESNVIGRQITINVKLQDKALTACQK
jgi:hypothetical protein